MSETNLPMIAAEMLNTPLMLHPSKAEVLLSVLGPRINVQAPALSELAKDPEMSAFIGKLAPGGAYRVQSGAAIIPVHGTLVNRGAWVGAHSGATSYEGLEASIKHALADDDVSRIILDINTPGGAVAGFLHMAEIIRQARTQKPVMAFVNDMAASAGYAIASACDKIFISKTSIIGSIGVVMVHMDHSQALEQRGIKPTIIHAGAQKAAGNPYESLPEGVRGEIQEQIDGVYTLFVSLVAESRQTLSEESIRAMEARTFFGQAALDAGLADGFGTLGDEINMKLDSDVMADNDDDESGSVSQEKLGAAVAGAREDGEAAAKTRIAAILESSEAEGREKLARKLAFEKSMSAEDALDILASAPKEQAESVDPKASAQKVAALAAEGAAAYVSEDGEVLAQKAGAGLDPAAIYGRRAAQSGGR